MPEGARNFNRFLCRQALWRLSNTAPHKKPGAIDRLFLGAVASFFIASGTDGCFDAKPAYHVRRSEICHRRSRCEGNSLVSIILSIFSLLSGIGLLLTGLGLLGTVLGVRAAQEGFPDALTGLVMSAYFAGFILGTYLCPGIVRRVGHIRAYAAFAATASVCAFAHALLVEPLTWSLLRLVTGVCLVGLYLVIESWLNSETPNAQRGRVFAVYMTVTLLAMALGQYLLLVDPAGGFATFGVASTLFSLGLVPVALTRHPEPRPVGVVQLHLRHLYDLSPSGVVGALVAGLATSAFWGMGAVFAQRIGLSGTGIATFMSVTIVGGVLLQWPIGWLSDRVDRRLVLLGVAMFSSGAAAATAAATLWSQTALYLWAFFLGGAMFSIYSLSVAYLNDRLDPHEALDASQGVLLVYGAGAVLGPLAGGLMMHPFGPRGLFIYMAGVLGIFVLFALTRLPVSSPVPEPERSTYMPMNRTSPVAAQLDPRTASDRPHQN